VKYSFVFDSIALTVFPWLETPSDGMEEGSRIEITKVKKNPANLELTRYDPVPLLIEGTVWRGDFFTFHPGERGNWDRTHHHFNVNGNQGLDEREWDKELTADPVAWFERQLDDHFETLLAACGALHLAEGIDREELREAKTAIMASVHATIRPKHLLAKTGGRDRPKS
jgi:hypothetical protein